MKKSVFSRIFSINILTIVISMIVLAISGYFLISNYVYNMRVDILKDNANSISRFINTGVTPEHMENFLHGFARSSKNDIIIIDSKGKILMHVSNEEDGESEKHNAVYIGEKYCKDVLEGREHILSGNLGGIYDTEMFTLQLPVFERNAKRIVGAVFISTPAPEMRTMQFQLYRTLVVAMIFVLVLSFGLSYALSKSISRPIKRIGQAVKKFAKGDFSSRVKVDKRSSNLIEIEELTTSFNDMAFHLEKADDIRNNFISDVSHELRTPMTTIAGFVDGILDGTIPEDKQKEYLMIVKEEISRLSSLVNSFLDVTRISSGNQKLEIANFDLNDTVSRTLFNFENKICEKQINVEVVFETDACFVKADKDAITRVLTNLIENAIKFTEKGGLLRISTGVRQQEVFVSVYNTGCGISEDDKKLIFERFYKVDKSRSRNREGTGIGLYIVKDILNRHGKGITVESTEGEYAEFTFTLDKGKKADAMPSAEEK